MIYTVTLNPAIDYVIHVDALLPGKMNRTTSADFQVGGKGINVSIILQRLGVTNTALGFVGGFTGKALQSKLTEMGIATDFIPLESGDTRINIKIEGNTETEINSQGPAISEEAWEEFLLKMDCLTPKDILVVSGSVPPSLPSDTYWQIMERIERAGALALVDTTGHHLWDSLDFHPFLVKPNLVELEETLQCTISNREDVIQGARKLQEAGARNVLVSLGKKGALLLTEDGDIFVEPPRPVTTVSTVGAGDTMVAGFLAGYLKTGDVRYALQLANAAGAATASSMGLASPEDIQICFEQGQHS